MKSTYTIVYSPINLVSQERLNLGLIMINESGNVSFKFSQEKLNFAKKLFPDNAFRLIKSYLIAIQQKLSDKGDLIDNLSDFKVDYLSYLANYSHNLIAFTKPNNINLELTKPNFSKLFEKYVYKMQDDILSPLVSPSQLSIVKESFIPKVKKRVNINVELKADEFDFVLFNMHVDMMGKNDIPVLNQFIDFQSSPYMLEKNISGYIGLIKPFELKDGIGKYFIVGDEPPKGQLKQHLIWKHLSESTLIKEDVLEVVTFNEIEKIEDYLEEHDVKPYFQE